MIMSPMITLITDGTVTIRTALFLFVLLSCGIKIPTTKGADGAPGVNGLPCTVTPVPQGAVLSCPDGTSTMLYNGINGDNGSQGIKGDTGMPGINGRDGSSCTVASVINGARIDCDDGSTQTILNGVSGPAGTAGTSCSVVQAPSGAELTCGSTTATLTNGRDGLDGTNGTDGQDGSDGINAIDVAIVPFCPTVPAVDGKHSENGIRIGNKLIAVYYAHSAKQVFLTPLSTGTNYVTTDGRVCAFTVGINGLPL